MRCWEYYSVLWRCVLQSCKLHVGLNQINSSPHFHLFKTSLNSWIIFSSMLVHFSCCFWMAKSLVESHPDWRWWWRGHCRSRGRRWPLDSGRSARSPSRPCSRRWGRKWQSQSVGRVIYRRRGHDMGSEVAWSLSEASFAQVFSSQCSNASGFPLETFPGLLLRTAKIQLMKPSILEMKFTFFFSALKLSMITPMKRLRVKKEPQTMKMTK